MAQKEQHSAYPHIARYIDDWLREYQPMLRAVMIDGAKGVGKTESAKQLANTVIELDDRGEQETLAANFDRIRSDTPPVLLDEWQYLPEVWDRVRRMVDDRIPRGSIILTGSIQTA